MHAVTLTAIARPATARSPARLSRITARSAFRTILYSAAMCLCLLGSAAARADFTDDQIDRAGQRVMEDRAFRSVRRRVLEQVPDVDADKGFLQGVLEWTDELVDSVFSAIGSFLRTLFNSLFSRNNQPAPTPSPGSDESSLLTAGLDGLAQLTLVLAIIAVLAVLLVIVARVVRARDQSRLRPGDLLDAEGQLLGDLSVPPGELSAATYEGRALRLASEGNYRAALRELLLGSMSWIERAGLIRYRRGLTNRDYVRSVWRRTDKREAFTVTALEFERVFFGRRTATAEVFEACLISFQGAFREEEQPTAAV